MSNCSTPPTGRDWLRLRAALEDATREEIITRNVAKLVRAPRPAKTEREPLTVQQVRELLKATRYHRLHALFVVFALLGLRRSETLGLRWEDVDLDAAVLRVRRSLHRADGKLAVFRLFPGSVWTYGGEGSV